MSAGSAVQDAALAVFGPTTILTIAIELASGGKPELHLHAGGQGHWIARMAAALGARVTLCSALGGESGSVLRGLLTDEAFDSLLVQATSANGAYIHDRRQGERRPIVEIAGPELSRHELDDLYDKTLTAALDCGTLVLAGPLDGPNEADVYRRLASDARSNGVTVIADLSGEAMTGALAGGVTLLKVSEADLAGQDSTGERDREGLLAAITTLHKSGAENVLISRAAAGALALIDGRALEINGPRVAAADPKGAGDSMTAAAAVGIARKQPHEEWLRLAVAAGIINATRHGLGTGGRHEIEQIVRHVVVRPFGRDVAQGPDAG